MAKKAFNSNKQEIGMFDGKTIRNINGNVIYWISDGEVFAPMSHKDSELSLLNKGQFQEIGKYEDYQCVVDGELLFRIE